MNVGVLLPYADGMVTSGGFLADWAGVLEGCGVESVWAVDHVVVADDYEPRYPYSSDGRMAGAPGTVPMPDPLDLLAFLAAVTTGLRLGTAMVVAPLHPPAVLAKRVATVDRLSGGRVELGLGIGWQREEYAAVGVPFERRGERLEDCIGALRSLWAAHPASFCGRHVRFDRVHSDPSPSAGSVPIVLGGHSVAAVERAGRLADGWFPFTAAPAEFAEKATRLAEAAGRAGRPPGEIALTAWPGSCDPRRELDVDFVRRYVDAGATRLVVHGHPDPTTGLDGLAERLDRYHQDVVSRL
ncbi:MAG: LLM class F420-dependent oxidoreductase [Acidimicrobiales bacterium]